MREVMEFIDNVNKTLKDELMVSLDEQIAIEQEKAKLMKRIEDMERKSRKETQAKKKFEMFLCLNAYQKRLEEMN